MFSKVQSYYFGYLGPHAKPYLETFIVDSDITFRRSLKVQFYKETLYYTMFIFYAYIFEKDVHQSQSWPISKTKPSNGL